MGSAGTYRVRWIDTTHPLGPEQASDSLWQEATTSPNAMDTTESSLNHVPKQTKNDSESSLVVPPTHARIQTQASSFADEEDWNRVYVKSSREVSIDSPASTDQKAVEKDGKVKIHSTVEIVFSNPLKNSLQMFDHKTIYMVTELGSLILIYLEDGFFRHDGADTCQSKTLVKQGVVCAVHDGDRLYVATLKNELLVFTLVNNKFERTDRYGLENSNQILDCTIRREKLLFNGKDGVLRLYDTFGIDAGAIWFQDVVNKAKFAAMNISSDGEYVIGAVNQFSNTKYGLFIWDNAGRLVDKLTGSGTTVQHVAWHPTRPMVAIACGDGMVDVWGTRINWTAFAPDFQALPENVEYIEQEDEFDLDESGQPIHQPQESLKDDEYVNVLMIEPVPAFASDSEDESSVFDFIPRVKNVIAAKGQKARSAAAMED